MNFQNKKVVNCWFSCGAASAVATKIVMKESSIPVNILNIGVVEEHSDNARFLIDCEKWFGVPITRLSNQKYNASIYEVFEREAYIIGPSGAACTKRLKRSIYKEYNSVDKILMIGFTSEEEERLEDLQQSLPDITIWAPLIENKLTKDDCIALIKKSGIDVPVMYKLGYQNNNCIGCVKGGMGYWNKIRIDFPDQFKKMAALQEKLQVFPFKETDGTRFNLNSLEPNRGNHLKEPSMSCSILCEVTHENIGSLFRKILKR